MNPQMHDRDVWAAVLMEHRRALLERVVREFPHVLKVCPSQVDIWRLRLRPRQPQSHKS